MRVREEIITDPDRLQQIIRGSLDLPDTDPITNFGRQSAVLIVYWADTELIAIAGFIPLDLFDTIAYLWMQSTPAVTKYKTAVARCGRLAIRDALARYPRIIGHCVAGTRSIPWLESLGAKFGPPTGLAVPFAIGD